jgi:hypothetical protein
MRALLVALLMAASLSCASEPRASTSYFLYVKDDGRTWCGYTDMTEFSAATKESAPTESARVTFASNDLVEITYQATPESGDWIVVDKYTPSKDQVVLRRATLLSQRRLQIIQETTIVGGAVAPFRVLSTSTLDGKPTTATDLDMPDVAVRQKLSSFPFMALVKEMRDRSSSKVCRRLQRVHRIVDRPLRRVEQLNVWRSPKHNAGILCAAFGRNPSRRTRCRAA